MNEKFVVILKSTFGSDKYTKLLEESGVKTENIPSITFNFINEENLKSCIRAPELYSGIIFTSTTSVRALSSIFKSLEAKIHENWKTKFNFSVGKATAQSARDLLDLDTFGSESGSSSVLAKLIVDNFHKEGKISSKPFVYPCSSLRSNSIVDEFKKYDIKLHEIVCYETILHPEFKILWENLVSEKGLPQVLVYFSPSSVEFTKDTIKAAYSSNTATPKFVAIGMSTLKALSDADMKPSLAAEKPDPESVVNIIKKYI